MKKLLILPILILLAACQSGQSLTPEQQIFSTTSQYAALQEQVVKYLSKPDCTAKVIVNCRKPELVSPLQKATNEASMVVIETNRLAKDGLAYDKQRLADVLQAVAAILAKG